MKMTIEPQCPVCMSPVDARHLEVYCSPYNNVTYKLYQCETCALQFWSPLHIDVSFYEQEGMDAYTDYHSGVRPFPSWALPFFRGIPVQSGKLLDIGCGDGAFLAKAEFHGFDPHGIDFDSKNVIIAKQKYGLKNIFCLSLDALANERAANEGKFSVVTCFEVLEHQAEPSVFFKNLRTLLRDDGYLAGSVPNRNRFLASLDRKVSTGDYPPHHYLWFSKRALLRCLRRSGFTNVVLVGSGRLAFIDLRRKFFRLLISRLGVGKGALAMAVGAISWLFVLPLWLGLLLFPPHIYFQARNSPARISP